MSLTKSILSCYVASYIYQNHFARCDIHLDEQCHQRSEVGLMSIVAKFYPIHIVVNCRERHLVNRAGRFLCCYPCQSKAIFYSRIFFCAILDICYLI